MAAAVRDIDIRQDGEEEIIGDFLCPISMVIMLDPVIAADGHSYERASIIGWFARQRELRQPILSPFTGAVLANTHLIANITLKKAIQEYQPLKQKMNAIRKETEELKSALSAQKESKRTLRKENQELRGKATERAKLELEHIQATTELNTIKTRIAETEVLLEKKNAELVRLTAALAKLTTENESIRETEAKKSVALENLQAVLTEKNAELVRLAAENESIRKMEAKKSVELNAALQAKIDTAFFIDRLMSPKIIDVIKKLEEYADLLQTPEKYRPVDTGYRIRQLEQTLPEEIRDARQISLKVLACFDKNTINLRQADQQLEKAKFLYYSGILHGRLLISSLSLLRDDDIATQHFTEAAEHGHCHAQYELGLIHIGCRTEKALYLFLYASMGGCQKSLREMCYLIDNGLIGEKCLTVVINKLRAEITTSQRRDAEIMQRRLLELENTLKPRLLVDLKFRIEAVIAQHEFTVMRDEWIAEQRRSTKSRKSAELKESAEQEEKKVFHQLRMH